MCGPMAGILSGGIGAMGAIAKYNAEVEDFNAGEARWVENYKSALESGRDEHNQLTTKAVQVASEASQRDFVYAAETATKASEAEASAAGAGVSGGTVDEVVRGVVANGARNRYYSQENAHWEAAKIADQQRGVVANTKSRINSVVRPRPPNAGAAILGVAGALLGGFS